MTIIFDLDGVLIDAPHGIEAAKQSGAVTIAVRGYEDVNINLFRRIGLYEY
jgi:phosphoglycolate phosphatase-like HAD superfamily hydrolase